ncbi:MAG: hypothetical protein AMK71_10730 [Nitrospira bacterium SG8_35_4]|nr:MAG: hypothetical protein AMK71_10730 [Nitrospira bacterium SG8_35_4]
MDEFSERRRTELKTLHAELPDKLYEQVKTLVEGGWFSNETDVVNEALRRFLESHKPELMEHFLKEDVEWGLHGKG